MLARSVLPDFDYVRAGTPGEVVRLLQEHGDEVRLMMGGTDLLVRMRDGLLAPRLVVDVKHLPGMGEVTYDERTGLTVGAAVTMNRLAGHPAVQAHYPLLAEAAQAVASYQVRSRATLGGNLCNASPAADTAPAVLLFEASIVLYGPDGEREVLAGAFFRGPGQTAMQAGELMTAIRFPPPPAGAVGRYLKLGRNRAGDLAIAGVAILAFPDGRGEETRSLRSGQASSLREGTAAGYRFRIGLASVGPVPLRVEKAEALLVTGEGGPAGPPLLAAAEEAAAACRPIDDVRASAAYRRAMVRNLALRGLRDVWESLNH